VLNREEEMVRPAAFIYQQSSNNDQSKRKGRIIHYWLGILLSTKRKENQRKLKYHAPAEE
jgi:hypothetical protein